MNYTEAIGFLYDRLPMYQMVGNSAFKKGLDNVIALCKELGNPHNSFRSVHIGGTNGKGSSAHMLAAILQSAGYKPGSIRRLTSRVLPNESKLMGRRLGSRRLFNSSGKTKI